MSAETGVAPMDAEESRWLMTKLVFKRFGFVADPVSRCILRACYGYRRKAAQNELRQKLLAHKEVDAKVRSLREEAKDLNKQYDKTEDDLKALQSIGQIIGEVLRQLDDERCANSCLSAAPIVRTLANEMARQPFLAAVLLWHISCRAALICLLYCLG